MGEDKTRTFLTKGSSMLPTILPGSRLHVAPARPDDLRPGDVACYIGQGSAVVAHRVVSTVGGEGNGTLVVKGDSQPTPETLPKSAVMYRVLRVENRFISYDTDGMMGRALARMALSDGIAVKGLQCALRTGISLAVFVKGFLRRR
ncbi:MAG: hypothetical protein PHU25_01075 [Deltaproteobacteria bacterium]|nr:hypothetical protein [Deltaproteobacteria bacterium]